MREHKGQNAFNWQVFLGFGFVLIDVFADRLNLVLPLDRWFLALRFLKHSPSMRDLMRGFGHRVMFGSRFPILPEERSPGLPGSLDDHHASNSLVEICKTPTR